MIAVRLVIVVTPEHAQDTIRAADNRKETRLNCLYSNTCNIGNKKDELEAIVQSESCNMIDMRNNCST